jgi:hypothetical protein
MTDDGHPRPQPGESVTPARLSGDARYFPAVSDYLLDGESALALVLLSIKYDLRVTVGEDRVRREYTLDTHHACVAATDRQVHLISGERSGYHSVLPYASLSGVDVEEGTGRREVRLRTAGGPTYSHVTATDGAQAYEETNRAIERLRSWSRDAPEGGPGAGWTEGFRRGLGEGLRNPEEWRNP